MQQHDGSPRVRSLEDTDGSDAWLELPAFDDIREIDADDDECPRTEIMPRLWVGGERAARALRDVRGWKLICVREADCLDSNNAVHVPLLRRETGGHPDKAVLDELAETIDVALEAGDEVLVHCWQGMERSPLVVASWLCTRQQMSLDGAYALLKRLRPQVDDCRDWLTRGARKALDRADSEAKEFEPRSATRRGVPSVPVVLPKDRFITFPTSPRLPSAAPWK